MSNPRILILMHYMELGGAESALLGLLQSIDPNRANVDVFIYAHRGELMEYVRGGDLRENVADGKFHLLPEIPVYSMLEEPIPLLINRGFWRLALVRLWGRIEGKRNQKYNVKRLPDNSEVTFQQRRTTLVLPDINPDVEYDLAVSFLTPHYICLDHVKAKRKVAWIHTDYTSVYVNREIELDMWQKYDAIGSISQEASNKFLEVFPSLAGKVQVIENILSAKFIRLRSELPCPVFENDKSIKILTIGRYSHAKKMEDIPYFCHKMVEAGLNVKWYIIGYGAPEYEEMVNSYIIAEGMQERVLLLGKQTNPYPYIRTCDIYVQPSRYEGKSITVREAQILCKPVMVTHYPTAPSQIVDGVDGVIVPLEREQCAEKMIDFIMNVPLQQRLIDFLSSHDYGNESEIEKIYRLAQ